MSANDKHAATYHPVVHDPECEHRTQTVVHDGVRYCAGCGGAAESGVQR